MLIVSSDRDTSDSFSFFFFLFFCKQLYSFSYYKHLVSLLIGPIVHFLASNFCFFFQCLRFVEMQKLVSFLGKMLWNWKLLVKCLDVHYMQYLHGLAAHGVHYLHRPGPTLQDAGFFFLPVSIL